MFAGAFVAQFDSTVMTEPSQTAFHDPTQRSQSTPIFRSDPSQQWKDATRSTRCDVLRRAVRSVAQGHVRLLTRTSTPTGNPRHLVEQRDRRLRIMHVGWCGQDHQRHTSGVRQDVPFAALFRTIRRVGTGVRPPKSARTLALSITTSEASTRPRRPNRAARRRGSMRRCSRRPPGCRGRWPRLRGYTSKRKASPSPTT